MLNFEQEIRRKIQYLVEQIQCIKEGGCAFTEPLLDYNSSNDTLSSTYVNNQTKTALIQLPKKTSDLINDGDGVSGPFGTGGTGGIGDMVKTVYDPDSINANAFDYNNLINVPINSDVKVVSGFVVGNNLTLVLSDNNNVIIDVTTLVDGGSDIRVSSGSVSGNNLTLTLSDSSTVVIDVSTLVTGLDVKLISGTVLGNDLTFTLSDSSTIIVDVSTLVGGGSANPLVQNLTLPNITDVLSTQGVQNALNLLTDIKLTSGVILGTSLLLTLSDSTIVSVDVTTLTDTGSDTVPVSGVVVGNNLTITMSDASTIIVDVTTLSGGGSGNPLVQDLTSPNAIDVLSTQGIQDALNAMGGGGTDDEKWIPNHDYAAKETFTISPTQQNAVLASGQKLTLGKVYSVYYDVATTSSATLVLSEILKLELSNPNELVKSREFVNGSMLFDGNVIYDTIHVQSGVESFALVSSADNVPGAEHYLKYTSNGDVINSTAVFNDFGKGVFAYMQSNPDTYELKFEYIKTDNIEEIWITAKRAESVGVSDVTGQHQGSYNEGDTLPDATINSGDFIFISKNNNEFWIQVSNGATWVDDKQIVDPIAIQALTIANNVQIQLNDISVVSRPFTPVITFDRDVTHAPIYNQTGDITLSLASSGNITGKSQFVRFVSNGGQINFPTAFKEMQLGMINYMISNPGSYPFMTMYMEEIGEVWMSSPRASSGDASTPQVATIVTLSVLTIQENNTLNQEIGDLGSDAVPDATSYVLAGADAAHFNVFDNGGILKLRATTLFNFEAPGSAASSNDYSLTFAAVNSEGTQVTPTSITVSVTDVSEAGNTVPDHVVNIFVRPDAGAIDDAIHIQWELPISDGGTPITGYQIERSTVLGGAWSVLVVDTGNTNLEYIDTGVGEGFYALYRVAAINNVGTGIAFGIATAITVDLISGGGFTGAVDNFNTHAVGTSPSTFDELLGNSVTEDISGGVIRALSWDSKTGGSYATNPWGTAQSKFNLFSDAQTDYTVLCHMTFKSQASKAGIWVRSTTNGSFTEGYFLQFDQVTDELKLWSIHSGGQFDQINPATVTTSMTLNDRHLIKIDIVGSLIEVFINNMTAPIISHTFIQNLHASGGVVLSAGWDGTNENNVQYDNLYCTLWDAATALPTAPLSLVAAAGAVPETEIDLTWLVPASDGGSAITGYRIERESPTGNGFALIVADTGDTNLSYSDTTLTSGVQYNYRVSAINGVGTGSFSNSSSLSTTTSNVLLTIGTPDYLYSADVVVGVEPVQQVIGSPDYQTIASSVTIITGMNGLPVWKFSTVASYIRTVTNIATVPQGFYRFMLIEFKSISGGNEYFGDGNAAPAPNRIGLKSGKWAIYGGSWVESTSSPVVDTPYLIEIYANGAASYMRVNDLEVLSGNPGSNDLRGTVLGNLSAMNAGCDVEIGLDYVNSSNLSAQNLLDIRTEIATMAGISL